MLSKRFESITRLSPEELEHMAAEGDTTLYEGISVENLTDIPVLFGGWDCRYVGGKLPGSVGNLVLVPNTPYTRRIWSKGQVDMAIRRGLTPTYAERWHAARCSNKHGLLDILVDVVCKDHLSVLNSNNVRCTRADLIKGYLEYDIDFTKHEYQQWKARYGIVEPRHPNRMAAFKGLLADVISDEEFQQRPVIGGERDGTIDARPWEI